MPALYSLVYVSTATRYLSAEDVEKILVGARRLNATADVTGLLLYDSGNFMHCIEGEVDSLMETYGHICQSGMHTGLIELLREPIVAREFAEWPLAFRVINTYGMNQLVEEDDRVLQKLENRDSASMTQSLILLSSFWKSAREQASFSDSGFGAADLSPRY